MKHCPECGSYKIEKVYERYPVDMKSAKQYTDKQLRKATCGSCGWKGLTHQLKD